MNKILCITSNLALISIIHNYIRYKYYDKILLHITVYLTSILNHYYTNIYLKYLDRVTVLYVIYNQSNASYIFFLPLIIFLYYKSKKTKKYVYHILLHILGSILINKEYEKYINNILINLYIKKTDSTTKKLITKKLITKKLKNDITYKRRKRERGRVRRGKRREKSIELNNEINQNWDIINSD